MRPSRHLSIAIKRAFPRPGATPSARRRPSSTPCSRGWAARIWSAPPTACRRARSGPVWSISQDRRQPVATSSTERASLADAAVRPPAGLAARLRPVVVPVLSLALLLLLWQIAALVADHPQRLPAPG